MNTHNIQTWLNVTIKILYEILEENAFLLFCIISVHVVKAACNFTEHCKHISTVNRKSNTTGHFDDKSTFTPVTPLGFAGTVGQICHFKQLFVYELPWQRGNKNVRNHSAEIIGLLLTSTVTPPGKKPEHLWDDKTHCCWSLGLWNKQDTEGGSFTSFLTLLDSFLSMDLELRGETTVQCSHKHCFSFIFCPAIV